MGKKLKKPTTFEQQVDILKEREMIIENRDSAKRILSTLNYYRFTGYALKFKKEDKYINNISFDKTYELYKFDKEIKNIIMGALESIEISVRTYMAYTLAHEYGSDAHTNYEIFENKEYYYGYRDNKGRYHKGLKDEFDNAINRNKEDKVVKHHNEKYKGNFHIWAIIEFISFGTLSRMYSNLKREDKRAISKGLLDLDYKVLESGLIHLTYVRNICAHYARLYDRKFTKLAKLHEKYNEYEIEKDSLFCTILVIKELMSNVNEWTVIRDKLEKLFNEYIDVIDLKQIGLLENWKEILYL